MAVQGIIYSVATGRVRRVVDPEMAVPNAITFLNEIGARQGEGTLLYTKVGGVLQDTLPAWQAAVNANTGLDPDALKADWYVAVDAQNAIQRWMVCDPLCGDLDPGGLTLVKAPWGADSRWTYDGVTFTAPIVTVKPTAS